MPTLNYYFELLQMKLKLLLFLNSILLASANGEVMPRVLNRNDYEASSSTIEKQMIQEYSSNITAVDTTIDDVIEEIIDSSRQGRDIDGLEEVYSDQTVKNALLSGDDPHARNLIRDKLCDLGLMDCEKRAPVRYIYTQPPPSSTYNNRPVAPTYNSRPPPPQSSSGIYGPARPVPLPGNQQHQPPRKVGYASPNVNNFHASKPLGPIHDKYSTDFYEVDSAPSSIKFGYTEKPTIIVNQGKREVLGSGGVSQNHHVHHHYVHVDGAAPVDGTKTILVNTPISEYSAVNSLSSAYQTSGFDQNGGGLNSYSPSSTDFEYKGVNSGTSQGVYGGLTNAKPVFETLSGSGFNQYSGTNSNQQTQSSNQGPAVFTDGSNGIYSAGSSYHALAPEFYKKELNINGNRGNTLSSYSQQQQYLNSQKQNKNQFNQGEQYQGFESARQEQIDCICVPLEQCPAHDVVGRRDDLILPLDPRNLPTEIEADSENSTSIRVNKEFDTSSSTKVKKISKREVEKVQGDSVSKLCSVENVFLILACVDRSDLNVF